MAVHAVAAGAVEIDEPHRIDRQSEELREGEAEAMRSLRRGPDGRPAVAHIRDRAGRPHRTMRLHRPVELALQPLVGAGERG